MWKTNYPFLMSLIILVATSVTATDYLPTSTLLNGMEDGTGLINQDFHKGQKLIRKTSGEISPNQILTEDALLKAAHSPRISSEQSLFLFNHLTAIASGT